MALNVYATQGTPSALLIPGSPSTHRRLRNGAEKFRKIAHGYFAAHPQDSVICLVTDTYVTRKLAIDYQQYSLDCHYVVNTRQGQIPEDFTIRHNSQSLVEIGGQCVFLERHLKLTRLKLSERFKSIWKTMVEYFPFFNLATDMCTARLWHQNHVTQRFTGYIPTVDQSVHGQASYYDPSRHHGHAPYTTRHWEVTLLQLCTGLWLSRYWIDNSVEFFLEWDGPFAFLEFQTQLETQAGHKGIWGCTDHSSCAN